MVIGPATDGGYWLIGLSRELLEPVVSWPFCDIPWGSSHVLGTTLKRANQAGVEYHLINQQNDIDTSTDLIPWTH